jgi:AcrR family transcriptional regulator
MLDLTTIKGRIVTAALRLAGECPWEQVTLVDIGEAAGVSLVDLRNAFSSKGDILAAFTRAVDDEVAVRAPKRAENQSSRDAIFEVIMSRLDILLPYKAALKSIAVSWPADTALLGAVLSSQAWMLRAAGVSPDGLDGQLRVAGLAALYVSAFRTWLEDDDPGLARTMAVLDRRLRRGERTLKSIDSAASTLRSFVSVFAGRRKQAQPRNETPPAPEPPPEAPV